MTYPVKYMPIEHWVGQCPVIAVVDTSFGGQGRTVCTTGTIEVAHRLAKLLNEDEGYVYAPGA